MSDRSEGYRLRKKHVAARYGVHPKTVEAWSRLGLLHPLKINGYVYYSEDDLLAFEQRHRHEPAEACAAG